jgi:hypothetical protein
MNPREELIALLRGQVACPLLSVLGELGWLDRMGAHSFRRADFPPDVDAPNFHAVMSYLVALGLVRTANDDCYEATELGRSVFARYGAFCLLNSYEDYFANFRALLIPNGAAPPAVDRLRNILGSGQLHRRKYFPAALALVDGARFDAIADVGCGDGAYLETAIRTLSPNIAFAVDLSADAVTRAAARLSAAFPTLELVSAVADAAHVASWTPKLRRRDNALISLWFVLHEISQGRSGPVVAFFNALHDELPQASILMGEIVRLKPQSLEAARAGSIMPEFTLFHDLSRQGLLGWSEWQEIATAIPYRRVAEKEYDPVADGTPSSFVWYLAPRAT